MRKAGRQEKRPRTAKVPTKGGSPQGYPQEGLKLLEKLKNW